MRKVLLPLLLIFCTFANAQAVLVRSGEHEGFTRLALEVPGLKGWSLSKTLDGYSLSILSKNPTFDLDEVFRRISKKRVSKIYAADDTGDLRLVIDCVCHALPFELENGILAIDIKDGQAPEASPFEKFVEQYPRSPSLSGHSMQSKAQLQTYEQTANLEHPVLPPLSRDILTATRLPNAFGPVFDLDTAPQIQALKNELLWQLSNGASDGIVEATDVFRKTSNDALLASPSQIRVGGDIGTSSNKTNGLDNRMTGSGQDCILDQDLDIGSWAGHANTGFAAAIALNTTNLVGEFDRPNPTTIARTVRFLLGLGFGAEARHVLDAFELNLPDKPVLESLSYILDLQQPPGKVFVGMEVCDTSAALWSILSNPELPTSSQIAIPAILRSFSALPLHLRRLLGPGLVSRFLAMEHADTAHAIQDSILRASGEASPSVKMMQAEIAIANRDASSANALLLPLSGSSGPVGLKATAALIQSNVDSNEDVSVDLVTTAESLLHQASGGEDEDLLAEALALGYASQNRFKEAFKLFASVDPKALKIWEILAKHGSDEALLSWGILRSSEQHPKLRAETINTIARRLLDLGFPNPALLWLGTTAKDDTSSGEEGRLLAAESELMLNKLPQAFDQLSGLRSEPAIRMRGNILAAMRAENAFDYLNSSGQSIEAAKVARRTGKWSEVRSLESGNIWGNAAELVISSPEVTNSITMVSPVPDSFIKSTGPLSQTRVILAESTLARAVLTKLLMK